MKQFLKHSLFFSILSIALCLLLVWMTSLFCQFTFDFDIPKHKNILVTGDSHTQYAINDRVVSNAVNLSQGGCAYFYSYLKIREIVDRNPHIDTVVLGYSYGDLKLKNEWFSGAEKIRFKTRTHSFLFNLEDYWALLEVNPITTLISIPQSIVYNLGLPICGHQCIGRYKGTPENKLDKARERLQKLENRRPKDGIEINDSLLTYQEKYLLKIYAYCQKKGISLILINVPIHPEFEQYQRNLKKAYVDFVSFEMPNVILLNHSNFKIPDEGFRDLEHLNSIGSKIYSEFLNKNGF